jgi:flagellar P-ring protein precursor FlgI
MLDPSTVEVRGTAGGQGSVIDLVTQIGDLEVKVDQAARVVINEASGTVVMNSDVRITPVAIAQGGLTITVTEAPQVSQPAPFSNGQTTVVPRTQVQVNDGNGASLAVINGPSLQSLVSGLNTLGVSPRDLITILQAIKSAGALQAEIEVQ